MNNYKEIGNYFCGTGSSAATMDNTPFTSAFTLKVVKGYSGNYVWQTFKELNTGKLAYRVFNGSIWMDFSYFSDDATIFVGTAIQSGDDLNDYTTPGRYNSTQASVTSTLLNIPENFASGFTMTVYRTYGDNVIQVIFRGGASNAIYTRAKTNAGWQSWYKYNGTQISS